MEKQGVIEFLTDLGVQEADMELLTSIIMEASKQPVRTMNMKEIYETLASQQKRTAKYIQNCTQTKVVKLRYSGNQEKLRDVFGCIDPHIRITPRKFVREAIRRLAQV